MSELPNTLQTVQGFTREGRALILDCADEEFEAAPFEVREETGAIVLDAGALAVRVERASCRVSFASRDGRSFCADAAGMRWADGRPAARRRGHTQSLC